MNKDEDKNLPQVIKDEIVSNFSSIVIDYSEILLDEFIESDVIKSIPIVGTIVNVCKVGSAVGNAFFAKKMLIFLMQLKNNKMDNDLRNELIRQIDKDDKVIEQTVVFLNRFDMEWKAKKQANLLQQYILGNYNWTEYCSVSQIIDSFTLADLSTFEIIMDNLKEDQLSIKDQENKNIIMDDFIHGSINRFVGFGILYPCNGMLGGMSSYKDLDYKITELGKKLSSNVFCIKKIT